MVAVGLLVSRNIMSLGIIQFLLRENQKLVRIYMNESNKGTQTKRPAKRDDREGNLSLHISIALSLALYVCACAFLCYIMCCPLALISFLPFSFQPNIGRFHCNVHVKHISCSRLGWFASTSVISCRYFICIESNGKSIRPILCVYTTQSMAFLFFFGIFNRFNFGYSVCACVCALVPFARGIIDGYLDLPHWLACIICVCSSHTHNRSL